MTSLAGLRVLALDVQATGASPSRNHILEVGWANTCASHHPMPAAVEAHLLLWPDDEEVPRRIERVTGLRKEDLTSPSAWTLEMAWTAIAAAARETAGPAARDPCTTIIHFRPFEEPYLRWLHQRFGSDEPFPFSILCTHEIAKRLLPDLPRLGLRSLAGYLDLSVPASRRSADHVVATALIWRHLVEILARTKGISDREQLLEWLTSNGASSRLP